MVAIAVALGGSCSDRRDAAVEPGPSIVALTAAPLVTRAGAVAVVPVAEPLFAVGATLRGRWSSDGALVEVTARAATRSSLAVFVPLSASGRCTLDVDTGDATARIVFQVVPASQVVDAPTVVAVARDRWRTTSAALRVAAESGGDADRLEDLGHVDAWLSQLDYALTWVTSGDLQALATVLAANPLLGSTGLCVAVVDPLSFGHGVALAHAARTAFDLGVAAVALGFDSDAPLPIKLAFVVGGLLAIAESLDAARVVSSVPVVPVGGLLVASEPPTSSLVSDLVFPLGTDFAVPLVATLEFGTLVAADCASPAPLLTAVCADLDAVRGAFDVMDAGTKERVASRLAPLPTVRTVMRRPVIAPHLGLIDNGSASVAVTLDEGVFRASATAAATTVVTIECAVDGFRFTTDLDVAVVLLPSNLIPIQPGTFTMGPEFSPETVHTVTLTRPFWMGRLEVTRFDHYTVLGGPPPGGAANQAWSSASRSLALTYCAELTGREAAVGRVPSGYQYRLPTEAEWEYCCRAGTTTPWSTGTSLTCANAAISLLSGPCGAFSGVVGLYPTNPWGLFDMHGNAPEWTMDRWPSLAGYAGDTLVDPYSSDGNLVAQRGGSWGSLDVQCQSTSRYVTNASATGGFRVVLAPILPW